MDHTINELLETTFALKENQGEDKVMPLEEAVRKYIEPKMLINIPGTPNGAINEITRQFWGKKPEFSFVSSMFTAIFVTRLIVDYITIRLKVDRLSI